MSCLLGAAPRPLGPGGNGAADNIGKPPLDTGKAIISTPPRQCFMPRTPRAGPRPSLAIPSRTFGKMADASQRQVPRPVAPSP